MIHEAIILHKAESRDYCFWEVHTATDTQSTDTKFLGSFMSEDANNDASMDERLADKQFSLAEVSGGELRMDVSLCREWSC